MQVVLRAKAKKQLKKLDSITQKRIAELFDELQELENPRQKGKALLGNFSGFWRYRVGDYRVICDIVDSEAIIYAIEIAHRSDVYLGFGR